LNEHYNEEHNINSTVPIYNNDNASLNVAFPNVSDNINKDVDANLIGEKASTHLRNNNVLLKETDQPTQQLDALHCCAKEFVRSFGIRRLVTQIAFGLLYLYIRYSVIVKSHLEVF